MELTRIGLYKRPQSNALAAMALLSIQTSSGTPTLFGMKVVDAETLHLTMTGMLLGIGLHRSHPELAAWLAEDFANNPDFEEAVQELANEARPYMKPEEQQPEGVNAQDGVSGTVG